MRRNVADSLKIWLASITTVKQSGPLQVSMEWPATGDIDRIWLASITTVRRRGPLQVTLTGSGWSASPPSGGEAHYRSGWSGLLLVRMEWPATGDIDRIWLASITTVRRSDYRSPRVMLTEMRTHFGPDPYPTFLNVRSGMTTVSLWTMGHMTQ